MPRSDDKSSFSPHEWYSVIASGVFAVAETRLKTASCLAVTIIQFLSSRVLLRHCEWRFARSNPLKLNFATLRIASFFAITSSNVIASGVFAVAETRLKTASCLAVTIIQFLSSRVVLRHCERRFRCCGNTFKDCFVPRSDDKSSFSPHECYSVIARGVSLLRKPA